MGSTTTKNKAAGIAIFIPPLVVLVVLVVLLD
jgi:hypothetical protein